MVQGTVDKLWRNERPDGSEYWVISIDGKRYSTWDQKLIENIEPGDRVEFAFTASGRYRNLLSLRRLPSPAFVTADKLTSPPEWLRVVRMNCLRTAAELLKDTNALPDRKLALVMDAADQLEQRVLRPVTGDTEDQQQSTHADAAAAKPTRRGKHDR